MADFENLGTNQEVTETSMTDGGETIVEVAQAAAGINPPPAGVPLTITVVPNQTIAIDGFSLADATITQQGPNLIVYLPGQGPIVLEGFLYFLDTAQPPVLVEADGDQISAQVLAQSIPDLDLTGIDTAAGPQPAPAPAPGAGGGAGFNPFDGGDIGDGLDTQNLLQFTELQFGAIGQEPEDLPVVTPPDVVEEVEPLTLCEMNCDQLQAFYEANWVRPDQNPEDIIGTGVGEEIQGTEQDDNIYGEGGGDRIEGLDGNDLIYGDPLGLFGGGGPFNVIYIVDVSGSMSGVKLAETKIALQALNDSIIDQGLAAVTQVAVIPFDNVVDISGPNAPDVFLTADGTGVSSGLDFETYINGLFASGGTNFTPPLEVAQAGLLLDDNYVGRSNFIFFLSDGQGSFNAGDPDIQELYNPATINAQIFSFGITAAASLTTLDIVDDLTDNDSAIQVLEPENLTAALLGGGSGANSGDDYLVGDEVWMYEEPEEVPLEALNNVQSTYLSVGAYQGSEGRTNDYNDMVFGGLGNDTVVGDVAWGEGGYGGLQAFTDHVNGATITAFNDYLRTGGGGGREVPEVDESDEGGSALVEDYDDIIVGDVMWTYQVGPMWELEEEEAEVEANQVLPQQGGLGYLYIYAQTMDGDGNTVDAYNDFICAGSDNDLLVGDVLVAVQYFEGEIVPLAQIDVQPFFDYTDVYLLAETWNGSSNDVTAFFDVIHGGDGDDTIVGDVWADQQADQYSYDDLELNVDLLASNGADSSYYEDIEGGVANQNTLFAFNDCLNGGDGNDLLVGDAMVAIDGGYYGEGGIDLEAENWANGASGYGHAGQANNNLITAFSDKIEGGDGDDTLVGDAYLSNSYGEGGYVDLAANNYAGGSESYYYGEGNDGAQADGNTITAFSDTLDAGTGDEWVVGDVFVESDTYSYYGEGGVFLWTDNAAYGNNNTYGEGTSASASNNTFNTFNDVLIASDVEETEPLPGLIEVDEFSDTLVGDVAYLGDSYGEGLVGLMVSNYAGGGYGPGSESGIADGNVFNSHNDVIEAGNDDSLLVGDMLNDSDGYRTTAFAEGSVANSARAGNNYADTQGQASGNEFNAFNDEMSAGFGDDWLIGDTYAEGTSSYSVAAASLSAGNFAEGGIADENEINAYNDTMDAGDGDNKLVGDMLVTTGHFLGDNDETIDENHAYAEGMVGNFAEGGASDYGIMAGSADGNSFSAFNDVMAAGEGGNLMVGDALVSAGGEYSEGYADLGVVNAAFASSGLIRSSAEAALYGEGVEVEVTANQNTFEAFNDTLTTGAFSEGDNFLVGDVYIQGGYGEYDYSEGGASANLYAVNEAFSLGSKAQDQKVLAADDNPFYEATAIASNNEFSAYNDTLTSGNGDGDFLVGDVYVNMGEYSEGLGYDFVGENLDPVVNLLVANAAVGGADIYFYGEGEYALDPGSQANNNVFDTFNDVLDAGNGANTLVGDVFVDVDGYGAEGDIRLAVWNQAGYVYEGPFGYSGGYGGTADDNVFNAYNDDLTAGDVINFYGQVPVEASDGPWGGSLLVGDVYTPDALYESETILSVTNIVGNYSGGASGNEFNAFNDTLTAGDVINFYGEGVFDAADGFGDGNLLVGDVLAWNADYQDIELYVENDYAGYDSDYGLGGADNNMFSVFNDVLVSGNGDDTLVGDVMIWDPYQTDVSLGVYNSADSYGEGADGNVFDAFNDSLDGGEGEDLLIGDAYVYYADLSLNIDVEGDDNTVDAFNDTINGGDDDDMIVGDVYFGDGGSSVEISVDALGGAVTAFSDTINGDEGNDTIYGDFFEYGFGDAQNYDEITFNLTNVDAAVLFDDVIDGGTGNDDIYGQLGDDTLTGGEGEDTFFYLDAAFDGDDTILDFEIGVDTVDLDALFDQLGSYSDADDRAEAVSFDTSSGTGTVLTITDGGASEFSITLNGVILTEDDAAGLFAQGIDVGS